MENNNITSTDPTVLRTSTAAAISRLAHPFNTFQDKIDSVTKGFVNSDLSIDLKIERWKNYFKEYYDNLETYNYYGLTIIEPF